MRANIPIDGLSSHELLKDWAWLVEGPHTVIAMTNFGDMFLRNGRGEIQLLDLVFGGLRKIASSQDEFQEKIGDKENQRTWFLTDFLTEIERSGLTLLPGQCFSFKKPPVLGGKIELCNIKIAPISVHVSLMGQIHRQVNKLPLGTQINGLKIQ